MESTYIIVLQDNNTNQFAFIRVLRFEPYISLLVACNLYDNYDSINRQILTGANMDFGNSIQQKQLDFSKQDYINWITDHDYIYKQVATCFGREFSYKRKFIADTTTTRIQPIINELATFPSPQTSENINIYRLKNKLTISMECEDIFYYTGLLINAFPDLDTELAIRNINQLTFDTFERMNKNQLDETEHRLIKWRESALQSLPIDIANGAYRELKNYTQSLCDKRDAFNSGYGLESDVKESATQLVSIYDTKISEVYKQGCYYAYIGLQLESSLLHVSQICASFVIPLTRPNPDLAAYKTVFWIVNQCKHRIANTIYNNTRKKLAQMETFFSFVNSLTDKQLHDIDTQLCHKYKRELCYIVTVVDEPSEEADHMFVKEYELYDEFKQTVYQLRKRQIESLLVNGNLPPIQCINYEFTVVYTFDYHEYSDDNLYMLMASIYSCIREFGSAAQIIVYTTNRNNLFVKYPELYKRVYIRDYSPPDYQQKKNGFSGSNAHFSTIGHARIFVVNDLLMETGRPVVYMDNDTGIQIGCGEKCLQLLVGLEKPMGFAEELYCTFADLIPGVEPELNPINNGIILYPYNEFTLSFTEQNIKIYNELPMNSIYNDMLSFTMTCHENKCLDTVYNGIETPCFIHYYMNKHSLNIHDFNSMFYLIFYSGENYDELQL